MAGDWIQMRHDLADDPAVIHVTCKTDLDEFAVIGRLHRLWSWADRQTIDGNAPSVTVAWLDRYLDCDGFGDVLIECGWLAELNDNGTGLRIPNFEEYISESAKHRALAARRARKHRSKSNAPTVTDSNAPSVTEALPREEKSKGKKRGVGVGSPPPPLVEIPSNLDTAEFRTAWGEWQQHRRETKKAMTPLAAKKQITKLTKMGHDQAVAAIEHSIAQSYTGIFEPGSHGKPKEFQTGTAEWLRKAQEAESHDAD